MTRPIVIAGATWLEISEHAEGVVIGCPGYGAQQLFASDEELFLTHVSAKCRFSARSSPRIAGSLRRRSASDEEAPYAQRAHLARHAHARGAAAFCARSDSIGAQAPLVSVRLCVRALRAVIRSGLIVSRSF